MLTFTDEEFKAQIKDDVGEAPEWASEAFPDLEESVRESVRRIQSSPFIPKTDAVRGFVYEVETGNLKEVG
jgi:carbonic anhydrase